ncbi:Putative BTB/POZ domain-containing protein [Septoria linicola]|uniref:BTB/POZ domain-containing protein n=1 Tax=Septoria linicola TaxID=215465 RepID=A0A9Q9EPL9_9PEZI|nr:Putative BTB/POZ domain-containing protein [Septoria linicola]
MAATQTTINKRLTLVINAPSREKESKKSGWTIQYEFKLWRFGAYQELHTFEVGPGAIPFTLHTNLLRERCPSFCDELLRCGGDVETPRNTFQDTCLLGDISPCPADRPFDIRSLSPGLFRVFSAWLYTGQLVLPDEHPPTSRPARRLVAKQAHKIVEGAGSWRDEDLIDVYLFASRHELWELSNLAITRLWNQNDRHCRTTALPAIERAFAAGAFGWDDSLGSSGPNQKPYLMRLQDYLLFEGAHRLHDDKDSWLDLLLTAHLFPAPYNRAVHSRYHESPRAIEQHHDNLPQPFWEYSPCYFHCHVSKEDQTLCKARCALPLPDALTLGIEPPRPVVGPTIHKLLRGTCTVLLGRGQVPFTLHKELACYHSGFFNETFGDAWHGPPNDKVVLLREQPRDFALFASWLYSAEITLPTIQEERIGDFVSPRPKTPKGKERVRRSEDSSSTRDSGIDVDSDSDKSFSLHLGGIQELSDDDSADSDEMTPARCAREPEPERETNEARFMVRKHQQDLIHLYAFAVRMKIPSLRNAVMDKFVEQRENGHPSASSLPDNLRLAYKLNLPHSLLCSYLIQEAAFTFRGLPRDRSGYAQLLPPQFLHDLLDYQFTRGIFPKLREHTPSWRVNLCEFHEHATEEDATTCATRNAEWQDALRQKGSTWEPIRKEFNQRLSLATPQTTIRPERTPTPRGNSRRASVAPRPTSTAPTIDTLFVPPSPAEPSRPAPSTPVTDSNRYSTYSHASSNMSSLSETELQLTPQADRPESDMKRKDSAVPSGGPDTNSSRSRSISSQDSDMTPPPTPIKDARRSAPPVPPKPPFESLQILQQALPTFAPSKRSNSTIASSSGGSGKETGRRLQDIDVFEYRRAQQSPPKVEESVQTQQSPPAAASTAHQAKAIHFSKHRAAAMARVSRFTGRPFQE